MEEEFQELNIAPTAEIPTAPAPPTQLSEAELAHVRGLFVTMQTQAVTVQAQSEETPYLKEQLLSLKRTLKAEPGQAKKPKLILSLEEQAAVVAELKESRQQEQVALREDHLKRVSEGLAPLGAAPSHVADPELFHNWHAKKGRNALTK